MGYYTRYTLTTTPDILDNIDFSYYFDDVTNYSLSNVDGSETIKWYEYHENMIEISRKYPDVVFCLRGEGEESGDIWQSFYKNGKTSSWKLGEIDYPKFDESELK